MEERLAAAEKRITRFIEGMELLLTEKEVLETRVGVLEGRVAELEGMIASIGQNRLGPVGHVQTVKVTNWSPPRGCAVCGGSREEPKKMSCAACRRWRVRAKKDSTEREKMRARLTVCAADQCDQPISHSGNNIVYFCKVHSEQWKLWLAQN